MNVHAYARMRGHSGRTVSERPQAPDRVRSAAATSGVPVPAHRVTVNLSPASIPKRGACFDLPIAVAVLSAAGVIPGGLARDVVHLGELGLDLFPVTSGSKGLHLYAPLPGKLNPDETTALAKEVAEGLQKAHPTLVTATMTKTKRSGKVFLDWSQNAGSKTTLSPYSLRGRERPTVATPLAWDEVEAGAEDPLDLEQFRFEAVLERVDDLGDLFQPR